MVVGADLLGSRHHCSWRGNAISLRYPEGKEIPLSPGEEDTFACIFDSRLTDRRLAFVPYIEIAVQFDSVEDDRMRFTNRLEEAESIATPFVTAYLDRLRALYGYTSEGLVGYSPPFVGPMVLQPSHGDEYRLGGGFHWRGGASHYDTVLDALNQPALIKELALDTPIPLGRALMADAQYFAYSDGEASPHLRQAVLIAAVACEVGVKQMLTSYASPDQGPLLSLLLNSPRDYSMAAVTLFHTASRAITGRSLSEENAQLYRRLERAFTIRNRIAHRGGEGVHQEDLVRAFVAAKASFEWLNTFDSPPDV
jgi:hypothetical protein